MVIDGSELLVAEVDVEMLGSSLTNAGLQHLLSRESMVKSGG
jgi:hypothetical protein